MSAPTRSTLPLRLAKVAGVGVVIVLALVAILTALRTELPRSPGVMSDAVGPDSGEPIAEYLDRADATLDATPLDTAGSPPGAEGGEESDGPRWALVSADGAWTAADADRVGRELPRVSALIVQVPVDGVSMPVTETIVAEPVAGEESREETFGRELERTAEGLDSEAAPSADGDRGARTAALTVTRIRAGDPAIIGLLVRGTTAQLRAVADEPGVRAVEALPPDAMWAHFAVRPLQPQQLESASPLPDTAPVPTG